MIFSVLIPAAGSGERLGSAMSKALIEIGGEAMFLRAAKPFLRFADCQEVVIAAPARDLSEFEQHAQRLADPRVRVIPGGTTRQESVERALEASSKTCDALLVHDAARPFITGSLIASVLDGLRDCSASLPGLPLKDTIKLVEDEGEFVEHTLPRDRLYAAQTPQAIRAELFREAHSLALNDRWTATDDVALIEHYHLGNVRIVPGSEGNFKITTPEDLRRAQQLVAQASGS